MKQILVALDFSDVSLLVLDHATELARAFGAKLWLLHVAAPDPDFVGYEPGPQHVRDNRAQVLREEHRQLQEWSKSLRTRGVEVTALLIQGPTVLTLLEEAKRLAVDAIVLGTHGHGRLYKLLMGSVCEGVIRAASVPVILVPARAGESASKTDAVAP